MTIQHLAPVTRASFLAGVCFLLLLAACQDEPGVGPARPGSGARRAPAAGGITPGPIEVPEGAAADDVGRITGHVTLVGDPPLPVPLKLVANTAGCLEHGVSPPTLDRVVVDAEGHLAGVVLRLLRAPDAPAGAEASRADPVRIDQTGCMFVPHLVAVQAGSVVEVSNSDSISHNVRLSAQRNRGRNETIGAAGAAVRFDLEYPEICELACDLHPWMKGLIVVVEHPWFAVSTRDGSFTIDGIPPGTYGLEAWHETYGRLRLRELRVPPGGTAVADVVFEP
jgi:plastocyanin